MFENEKRNGKTIINTFSHITAEEENIVRQNVNTKYFDVEYFINYLNEHDFIGIEIFNNSLLPNNSVGWTYLNYLKSVERSTFIKRIPIYFYDLDCDSDDISLTDFFNEYKAEKTGIPMLGSRMLSCFDAEIEQNDFKNFDFEPLYKIIDDIVFSFKIPIHLVLEYLKKQCGRDIKYWIFEIWFNYIKIVENLSEKNVFPPNILYSYNVERIRLNEKPVIYHPILTSTNDFLTRKENGFLYIGGFFPKDENGRLVAKWIGIWLENNLDPTEDEINEVLKANKNKDGRPALRVSAKIKLSPDSLIFAAREITKGKDVFGEEQKTEMWEQVYVGPRRMEFDFDALKKIREESNVSLKTLSEATNINIRTLQRIETGESSPDGLNLIKIMDYLNIYDYSSLVIHKKIEDPNFDKYRSGKKPSEYI